MNNRIKTMLLLFGDYLICLLLQLLCLLAFSMLLKYQWGNVVYSVFLTFILFGMIYSRTHRAAKRDMLLKTERSMGEGFIMALPLTIFNFLIALAFLLIQSNIIPIRDMVVNTVYSFPENEPRVVTDILLIDYVTPIVRAWFRSLVGFMKSGTTSAPQLFLVPALNLVAGGVGYIAGRKKFFLSDHLFVAKEKVKEKFNE